MSLRYTGAWLQDGAFDPLTAPTPIVNYQPYLYSWGTNSSGQLGLGNRTNYSSPKQVGSLTNWSEISLSNAHFVAIKNDGTLWSWGAGSFGRLGLGNETNYSSPKQVGSLTNWLYVSASTYGFTTALKKDGTLWSWGYNDEGQLGLGNVTNYSSPKQVGSLTNWKTVSTSWDFVLAIKTDGTLWSWGTNSSGQLGLGDITKRSSPVQVGSLTNWLSVGCGRYSFSTAVKTDGTIWTWGNNARGNLGLGNTTDYSSPKQVGSLTVWKSTDCSRDSVNAIRTTGQLWAWGFNNGGQLGDGTIVNKSSPIQIGALTDWLKIGCGNYSTYALKTNGTMWAWGANSNGMLGLGDTTNRSSPVQVGSLTTWLEVDGSTGSWAAALQY